MPPIPKSSQKFTGSGSAGTRKGRLRDEVGGEFSSAPRTPTGGASRPTKIGRQTKEDILRDQIGRTYFMIGAMLKPFGKFYPVMSEIGKNCQEVANDAAEAWMDLAQKDSKVKDALERMVGASAWGNVIGIHLVIFATALPGGEFLVQPGNDSEYNAAEEEAIAKLREMGVSESDIGEALKYARQQFGQGDPIPNMPAQENGNGAGIQTPNEQGAVNVDSPEVGDI